MRKKALIVLLALAATLASCRQESGESSFDERFDKDMKMTKDAAPYTETGPGINDGADKIDTLGNIGNKTSEPLEEDEVRP